MRRLLNSNSMAINSTILILKIIIPSMLISIGMYCFSQEFIVVKNQFAYQEKKVDYFSVLVAPIVETWILMKVIDLYDTSSSRNKKSINIGIFFGVLHAIFYLPSLISSVWSFYCLSSTFIDTTNKINKRTAFVQSVVVHTIVNTIAFTIYSISIITELGA